MEVAEEYFSSHPYTSRCNAAKVIPTSLKVLLVKMLDAVPERRPSLEDILTGDEWMTSKENELPLIKYQQMMYYIKMVVDGKDPEKLFPKQPTSQVSE